ncbi:DUF2264 domain-containing protein [Streptomyces marincola]|uniref:DUF2264 domain-containing protein n=1 Tax=Streptomyces marincola TaxID=2878388 RepID=UPI001CF4AEBB|nr:DUF2264 domain-containing protein [Streptomyces marincola]UCM88633.1 DUF2264 domain-containing protein [Streptomyces marincola]
MTHDPAGPAPDTERSPHTGLTRAHWEHTADRLLGAVRRHARPGNALIDLPGPPSGSGTWSDGLEGFARTFLLAAFRAAHAPEDEAARILAPWAEGLAHGSDPAAPHRWPRPADVRQARVEAASIAIGLHETRHLLWDRLPDPVRERLCDWLSDLAGAEVPPNNWVWFRAVTAAFLRSVGAPHSAADIEHAIAETDGWYLGHGWYTDGRRTNVDHYNGWAMHLYPLWYCRVSGADAEPGLRERYRERLRAFLTDAAHLVAGDGAPLHQGRSLTYRFAAAAPFWNGVLFGADPLPPGLARRAASGMLRHFTERGALEPDGLLSLGWHRPFEPVRQRYSGPASPYWASKGFSGLLLPPDHPAWTVREAPLPVERGGFTRVLPAPGWVVSGTAADGVIRVANHGTEHSNGYEPFYSRAAYTTHTSPDVADDAPGNRTSVLAADGTPSRRGPLRRVLAEGRTAVSRHRATWPDEEARDREAPGPWVTEAAVLNGPWEVRLVALAPGRRVRIGGHALAADEPPAGHGGAVRRADGLTSGLVAPGGGGEARLHRAEGVNAFGRYSATPVYEAAGPLHAVAVFLGATADGTLPPAPAWETAPASAPGSVQVTVRWPDGSTDSVVLPAP